MDLSGMLNEDPRKPFGTEPTPPQPPQQPQRHRIPIPDDIVTKEKSTILQLSTALQFAVAREAKLSRQQQQTLPQQQQYQSPSLSSPKQPFASTATPNVITPQQQQHNTNNGPVPPPPASNCVRLGPEATMNPAGWQPSLSLDFVTRDQPALVDRRNGRVNSKQVELYTEQIIYRGDEPKLLLESNYEIQGSYPRGFFVVMAKRSIQHNFVFRYPDHPWFEDLYGLRKSAYIEMRTEDGGSWELHLKISRDKQYLFGYLCKHEDMLRIVKEAMEGLLFSRKLPLVLDLDDTLVRLVGEGNDRHVPESDVHKYGNRVVALSDNRRVVLTERVHEFLDWAQNYYEISVCSLGDQNYVENVVNVLDPDRSRIRGILYSARFEHDYIKRSPDPSRPPKDLTALYPFCALKERALGCGFTLPLIIDDETRMWPLDQHDNIIVVKSQTGHTMWNVNLFPLIQETLGNIHQDFFRQLDSWRSKHMEAAQNGLICTREPPSAIGIYKTYLRSMFRDMIAARRF